MACGGERAGSVALRPGDTLLDVLASARLVGHPSSSIPPEVTARLAQRAEPVVIPAGAWSESGPPDAAKRAWFEELLGHRGELKRWHVLPAQPLDQPGGSVRFVHDGTELRSLGRMTSEIASVRRLMWGDLPRGVVFWWDGSTGTLQAFSASPPGDVIAEFSKDAAQDVGRYEWSRSSSAATPAPTDLHGRFQFGRTTRRGVLLPAPATLEFPVAELPGGTLELALGVIDHAYAVEDEQLRPAPGLGDGVTFAVEVVADGDVVRAWSRHLLPGDEVVEARVDLSAYRGRAVTLRLLSEAGSAGNHAFDYAVWSDLRLLGPPSGPPERPHIILIDIDTLRADRLGCYGHSRETSPRIDAWAARRAVLYRSASATSSWTLPSTASILTGLDVQQHGATNLQVRLPAAAVPVAVRLGRAGYETRAITDGGGVVPAFGFDRGFDRFDVREGSDVDYDPRWGEALDWLDRKDSERPVFLFLQTYLVHAPFHDSGRFPEPHPDETAWLSEQPIDREVILPFQKGQLALDANERQAIGRIYDEGVARMDAIVGAFLESLDVVLDGQEALVIVTSDHGEELFDHDGIEHGHALYQELLHVPLLVAFPDGRQPGVVEQPVSTLDLVPTLLDIAGLPRDDGLPGRSLLADQDPQRRLVGHTQQDPRAPPLHSLRLDGNKIILRGELDQVVAPEAIGLYDLGQDPTERHDLAAERPDLLRKMQDALRDYLASYPSLGGAGGAGENAAELPTRVVEDLRALGYIGDEDVAPRDG
jgi:arylsulfatase A-like enzyme